MLTQRGSWVVGFINLAIAILMLLSSAMAGGAQTTSQVPLQFDFLTPGARAMATGGAFIGAADDATAAFTNPAGLAWRTLREVSFEGRFRRFETPFLSAGRISGAITGRGLDVIPNPVYSVDIDSGAGPAFLSVMLPTRAGTLTVYGHQLMRVRNTFQTSGVFERFTFGGTTDDNGRELPVGGSRRVGIVTAGATFGRLLGERVAVGAGLSLSHLSIDSSFARLGVESLFGPVLPGVRSATAVQSSGDVAPSLNAGALVRARDWLQVGATYRRGASFSFTQEDRVFDAGTVLLRKGRFKVPDVVGAGVQVKLSESVRLMLDYDFVHYSALKRDFIDFQAISSGRQDQVMVDNAHEWHAGIEYQVLRQGLPPLAFRAGWWRDPAHAPRYEATSRGDELDVLLAATLPGGTDLMHYTFGAGMLIAGWLELNGAADVSSRSTAVTTSGVIRF